MNLDTLKDGILQGRGGKHNSKRFFMIKLEITISCILFTLALFLDNSYFSEIFSLGILIKKIIIKTMIIKTSEIKHKI